MPDLRINPKIIEAMRERADDLMKEANKHKDNWGWTDQSSQDGMHDALQEYSWYAAKREAAGTYHHVANLLEGGC